ncbi:MAG: hypothetical protein U5R31_04385 [Acidimicrobiia bacterium]|nr:hypothetical protein [Acidimicrobiia bacterium]
MAGRFEAIAWGGRTAGAWVPEPVAGRTFALPEALARRTEQAAAAVRLADERLPGSWEPIARILLRSEGVASSDIEGLRAPVTDVVLAEVDAGAVDRSAAWIADNLDVVRRAVRAADEPLTTDALHSWHAQLMRRGGLAPSWSAATGTHRDGSAVRARSTPVSSRRLPRISPT